jgi:hypothetical protein
MLPTKEKLIDEYDRLQELVFLLQAENDKLQADWEGECIEYAMAQADADTLKEEVERFRWHYPPEMPENPDDIIAEICRPAVSPEIGIPNWHKARCAGAVVEADKWL